MCLALLRPLCTLAEEKHPGDFRCEVPEDGTAKITGRNGDSEKLQIPDRIEGYTVPVIGDRAFQYNASVAEITLPDTVKVIGRNAFGNCRNPQKVKLPAGMEAIDDQAFSSTSDQLVLRAAAGSFAENWCVLHAMHCETC